MSQVVYISVEPSHQTTVEGTTTNTWIHPHLNEATDATKGRQFRASHLIAQGACLLIDRPYAILPVVDDPASNDTLLCSNPTCNQPAPCHRGGRSPCPNACVADVVWCSAVCRDADAARHAFECTWLKRYAAPLRNKRSEYEFGILWLIVRLLATRQIEFHAQHAQHHNHPLSRDTSAANHRWKHGWAAIDALCGSVDSWSHDQVRSWMTLVKKYLPNSSVLPHGLTPDRVLHLVCQEEANSFGLYPRETGVFPLPDPPMGRGEQYAAAVYPTAAIMNHSCLPNVTHKPDEQGRMVFTASRDILPGEECCIAYFDLSHYTDLSARRDHLRKSFRFVCHCERCVSEEEPVEETLEWTAMPLMDI